MPLSEVTARLSARWGLPEQRVTLLPMSDTPVETHVVVDEGEGPRAVHFQEWWVRMRAAVPAQRFVAVGMDRATAAPGVLDAIREADVVLLPPSNPVVSIGIILGVPGVRDALRGSRAPVVGVSPLIGGAPVRGHADACLSAIGVESTTSAVAGLYADFLDGWLVDDADKALADAPGRLRVRRPAALDARRAVDRGHRRRGPGPGAEPAHRRRMTRSPAPVVLTPLLGMPEVRPGDDLASLVLDAVSANGMALRDGDLLVVSSKVASKALGLTAPAGDRAAAVLGQARRVVAERDTPLGVTRVVEAVAGPVMAAAGVDASNTGADDVVLLLPQDPDAVARDLREAILQRTPGVAVGVVLSDTAGRPWRVGQTDFALGSAGVRLVDDLRGGHDADGRPLSVTERCVGDEIAAAADLVKGKASGVPVALVRGLAAAVTPGNVAPGARSLVRTGPSDWFGSGRVEAVRAALGVEAGTDLATEVGIPSALPEPTAVRLERAGPRRTAGSRRGDGLRRPGRRHPGRRRRVHPRRRGLPPGVALHGEGLSATVGRPQPSGAHLQVRVCEGRRRTGTAGAERARCCRVHGRRRPARFAGCRRADPPGSRGGVTGGVGRLRR